MPISKANALRKKFSFDSFSFPKRNEMDTYTVLSPLDWTKPWMTRSMLT